MENNNIGNTANYDGFGTGENGVDNTKNELDSSFYEERASEAPAVEETPGANAAAVAEDLNRINAERGETAIAASDAREKALDTSFTEQAVLNEAIEKDTSNEKAIERLKQVNEYINKLIAELESSASSANASVQPSADNLASNQLENMSLGAETVTNKGPEGLENADTSEQNDMFLGKDNRVYSDKQDAIDSFER